MSSARSGARSGGRPETRRAVLEAALELLEERGAATTMGDIAERAGVSRQALYLHFDNRADLLTQLVTWMDEERYDLAGFFDDVEATDEPVDRLTRFVDAALRYQPLVAPVAQALMDAAHHGDKAAATAFDNRMQARLAACRSRVRELEAAGRLAEGLTPDTATDLLWALIGYPLWLDLTTGRSWSDDRARRELVRVASRTLVDPGVPAVEGARDG